MDSQEAWTIAGFILTLGIGLSGWLAFWHQRNLAKVRVEASVGPIPYGTTPERTKVMFDLRLTNRGRVPAVLEYAELTIKKQKTSFVVVPIDGKNPFDQPPLESGQSRSLAVRMESRPGISPSGMTAKLVLRIATGERIVIPFRFSDHSIQGRIFKSR